MKLQVALLQLDIEAGNPEANFQKVEALLAQAAAREPKPDVIVLPEMWNTGYALDRIGELADRDGERTKQMISAFCQKHRIQVVAGSVASAGENGVTNTIYAFNREGAVDADYSKLHLFRLMQEEKHLQGGDKLGTLSVDGEPAGMMICYDIRFPELARKLALGGAKLLFVPAEWPNPRQHHWRTLLQARAIENQMYVIACNRVGEDRGEDGKVTSFFGHSMVIDPWGEVLVEGGEEEAILTAEIDLSKVEAVRRTIPVFEDRRPAFY